MHNEPFCELYEEENVKIKGVLFKKGWKMKDQPPVEVLQDDGPG